MKRFTFLGITALFALNITISAQRGTIVEAIPLVTLTPEEIMASLRAQLPELNFSLIDYFTYKKYNVQAVKILYNTIDGKGSPTVASGVAFLPAVEKVTKMPVFTYLHGTLTRDIDAPSYLTGIESVVGWIMAMDGYIALEPDYLGLGAGPGIHPYLHADSEASASIDMMKALIQLCSNPLILTKPDGNLYLSGYSQGAHAALATQRELQAHPIAGLSLKKTIAGSGAYSLSNIQKNFLFDNPEYPNPSFIPFLLLGYQNVYGNLYTSLSQVFVAPYNSTIPGLFDGSKTVEEIDSQLPVRWESMFVPSYLWNFRYRYFHPVNIALRANDLINWKPVTDLHLYYCTCDELVANGNSLLAYLMFVLKGSTSVTCLPLGPFSHVDCAPFVLLLAKLQTDCSSGANPCGLDKPLPLDLTKSIAEADLSMLQKSMNRYETLDLEDVYANKEVSEFVANISRTEQPLTIYPNPATDIVYIEIPDGISVNSRLCLYNTLGTLLVSKNIDRSIMTIDVSSLSEGLYKVIVTGQVTYSGTVIVK
ncbi:MAG: T9SS type A sorting domain-containing protein [Bacteroidales bacterium]|nr:T9SS type A sorting domain-containing protein [Bacteroidales bacterium]